MKADQIKRIDLWARQRFTYVADTPGRDTWSSFAAAVMREERWSGDCDDLASTTLDLLHHYGAAPSDMARLMVSSAGTDKIDHMVATIRDDDGETWVVGDTFGRAYRWRDLKHKVLQVSPTTGIAWYKPASAPVKEADKPVD